jgi:hypothetical protein
VNICCQGGKTFADLCQSNYVNKKLFCSKGSCSYWVKLLRSFISKILLRYLLIVGSLCVLLKKEIHLYSVSVYKNRQLLCKSPIITGRCDKLRDVLSGDYVFPHSDSASNVDEPGAVGTVYGAPHSVLCAVARVASHILCTIDRGLRYVIAVTSSRRDIIFITGGHRPSAPLVGL